MVGGIDVQVGFLDGENCTLWNELFSRYFSHVLVESQHKRVRMFILHTNKQPRPRLCDRTDSAYDKDSSMVAVLYLQVGDGDLGVEGI